MEPTNDVKKTICKENLQRVINSVYECVIQKRVFDRVGDKDSAANVLMQLEKLERMKDEYEAILKEIDAPATAA